VTGLTIVDAILDGQRDAAVLAKLRDPHIKASEEIIVSFRQPCLAGDLPDCYRR